MSPRRYPNAETLLAEVVESTGLSDFGPGDFRAGLGALLDSLERDGDLSPATDDAVVGAFRRRLANRLYVEQWYAAHPEIADQTIRGPVDIHGLPRTGTTALANMMSLDPQMRPLRSWEQVAPVPPPILGNEENDPRRVAQAKENAEVPPELQAMHLYELDATMEDTDLLGMAFHGQQMTLPVWSYHAWWRDSDLTETYEYHRRVCLLLQSQCPPNLWLFKAPHHKFHLEPLVAAYPDIRFIMTHRDPAKVVPSYSSIVSTVFPAPEGKRDFHRVGHEISNHLRIGMENAIAARERIGEDRFLDVHHHDVLSDLRGTMRRVYDFLGFELTPEVEQTFLDYQERNATGARGAHNYTPEQFGLTKAQLRSDYAFYIERFDIRIDD
jgi:hypothetical protein